jgi:hypothetical protein
LMCVCVSVVCLLVRALQEAPGASDVRFCCECGVQPLQPVALFLCLQPGICKGWRRRFVGMLCGALCRSGPCGSFSFRGKRGRGGGGCFQVVIWQPSSCAGNTGSNPNPFINVRLPPPGCTGAVAVCLGGGASASVRCGEGALQATDSTQSKLPVMIPRCSAISSVTLPLLSHLHQHVICMHVGVGGWCGAGNALSRATF